MRFLVILKLSYVTEEDMKVSYVSFTVFFLLSQVSVYQAIRVHSYQVPTTYVSDPP